MIKGHYDCILGRQVCGWAFDSAQPTRRLEIDVYIQGQCILSGVAAAHFAIHDLNDVEDYRLAGQGDSIERETHRQRRLAGALP